jgi:hypothetical protein
MGRGEGRGEGEERACYRLRRERAEGEREEGLLQLEEREQRE